jgi:excisionase family DNA binding protein
MSQGTPITVVLDIPPEALRAIEDRVVARIKKAAYSDEAYVDAKRAAEHLACSTDAIYRGVRAGRIPYRKNGSRYLFRLSELDAGLEVGGNGASC